MAPDKHTLVSGVVDLIAQRVGFAEAEAEAKALAAASPEEHAYAFKLANLYVTHDRRGDAEAVLRTNLLSPISLLLPLANHLEREGAGDIAVLSSVAGERGRPRNFTYGAAKAGLTVYTQGLRSRLWPRGVGVHTFKLGPVDTPMTIDHPKNLLFAQVDAVADAIVAGIDAKVGEVYTPGYWRPILGVVRRLPESIFQRVAALAGR